MCCGGGGSVNSQYDPQVGEAAKMNADTAKESLEFTKSYFNDVLRPAQEKADARADKAQLQADEQFAANREREKLFDTQYRTYGLPAEERFFKMASEYSAPEEEERQARLAIGDVQIAGQGQQGALMRRFSSLGIDPTSPAAVAAMTDANVVGTTLQAAAANKARGAARTLGMALNSEAANFGRGIPAQTATFSQLASGNTGQGFAYGQAPVGNAINAGGFMQQGYRGANAAYGQNLSSLVSAANADRAAQAQIEAGEAAGIGSAIGGAAGLAGAFMFGPRK